MKIRKVDDKPMVIHTNEKAKIHAHEAKKHIKKVETGKKLAKMTAKKAAKDTAKTVAKETAKETAKTTATQRNMFRKV